MNQEHDNSYKQFFSYPRMVRDLLQGFVKEDWVNELDLDSLEKASGSFVSDDLRDRETDVIWRVRWKGRWLYLYLLIEFQSRVDKYMAIRLLTYVGLLYQELINQKQEGPEGKLPPVLPIVIYNGNPEWTAPQNCRDLLEKVPNSLAKYQPELRYLLLDEGRQRAEDLPLKNLVSALIQLENSRKVENIQQVIESLINWLVADDQETAGLRKAFAVWLLKSLLPARLKGQPLPSLGNLQEVKSMLSDHVQEWTTEWMERGVAKGLEKGRQEGRQEGLQEGIEKGVEVGQLKGKAAILGRIIRKRYGNLPDWANARLHSATAEQLDLWTEGLFEANRLEDLMGEP